MEYQREAHPVGASQGRGSEAIATSPQFAPRLKRFRLHFFGGTSSKFHPTRQHQNQTMAVLGGLKFVEYRRSEVLNVVNRLVFLDEPRCASGKKDSLLSGFHISGAESLFQSCDDISLLVGVGVRAVSKRCLEPRLLFWRQSADIVVEDGVQPDHDIHITLGVDVGVVPV